MTKIAKKLVLASAIGAAGFAFAVEANAVRLSFKPVAGGYNSGKDASGEWYAVCGSKDATFAGITADCKAVDTEDDVVFGTLKVNSAGLVTCAFDKGDYNNFFVYLLDTRDTAGAASATAPTVVNGVKEVASNIESGTASNLVNADASGKAFGFTAAPAGITEAKISKIDATSDPENVLITVTGTHAAIKYNVSEGADPAAAAAAETPASDVQAGGAAEVTFPVKKSPDGGAQFFQLMRQPL